MRYQWRWVCILTITHLYIYTQCSILAIAIIVANIWIYLPQQLVVSKYLNLTTHLHCQILVKNMLKTKSFSNPYNKLDTSSSNTTSTTTPGNRRVLIAPIRYSHSAHPINQPIHLYAHMPSGTCVTNFTSLYILRLL